MQPSDFFDHVNRVSRYAFFLRAGLDYGNASGPLTQDLSRPFGGLRRFVVPFVEFESPLFSSSFLNIFIPHGLFEGTNPAEIPITLLEDDEAVRVLLRCTCLTVYAIAELHYHTS